MEAPEKANNNTGREYNSAMVDKPSFLAPLYVSLVGNGEARPLIRRAEVTLGGNALYLKAFASHGDVDNNTVRWRLRTGPAT